MNGAARIGCIDLDGLERDAVPASHDELRDERAQVAAAQVDIRAFAPLYERYSLAVYNYCLRRLSNPDVAADVASQVFLRAISALPRFRESSRRSGSGFRSWLFSIAHNMVVDQYRRTHPPHISLTTSPVNGSQEFDIVDPASGPEQHALDDDEGNQVRNLLAQLPERQRSVVELRLAGLSTAEISTCLGMTPAAAKAAQARAYATLRDIVRSTSRPPDSVRRT